MPVVDLRAFSLLFSVLAAGLWFVIFFVAGVMVSSHGQQLLATLDAAVNSSPLMSSDQKARAMRLT